MSKDDRWENFDKFTTRKNRQDFGEDRKENKKKRKIKLRQDRRKRDRARDGWE